MSIAIFVRQTSLLYACCGCLVVVVAGCGDSGMPTKRIDGRVTFQGGAPPKAGEIYFAPAEAFDGLPKRPAGATFDEAGRFTVTTFEEGDGLLPGVYHVNIACWREKVTLATKVSANYVPPDFRHEITIESDAEEPVIVEIDVPKLQQ